jgi:uncharacterized protein YuzE
MRLHVDREADALYLRLDESEIVESEEVSPGVVLDYNADEQVVGIEILELSKRTPNLEAGKLVFETTPAWRAADLPRTITPERLDLPESSLPKQPARVQPARLTAKDLQWPPALAARLGETAPQALSAWGNLSLLRARKTGFFCSARTPGHAILRAHDAARRLRDEGVTVISGFHSPIEKECLRILLRGKSRSRAVMRRATRSSCSRSDWARRPTYSPRG